MIFLLYILRIIYPLSSGMMEGLVWSMKGVNSFKFDEHYITDAQRIFLTVLILYIAAGWQFDFLAPLDVLIAEICYIGSFPFFQAGMYYQSRHWIDKAYKGFWSDSTTSSAKLNFSFKVRLILFLVSLIILVIYEIYT